MIGPIQQDYQMIDVRKVKPVIGAEILGVDLSQPLGTSRRRTSSAASTGGPIQSRCEITAASSTVRSTTITRIAATDPRNDSLRKAFLPELRKQIGEQGGACNSLTIDRCSSSWALQIDEAAV